MKRGDKVEVTIAGHVVAHAEVKELGDGTATLIVPATAVVMGTRTNLTDLPREEPTTQHIITGVDRATGESAAAVQGSSPTPGTGETTNATDAASTTTTTSERGPQVESNPTAVGETTVVATPSTTTAAEGESSTTPASPVEQSTASA